ncbi:MAG TPA: hypothetical protein PLI96_08005 [Halothiobacillus sp.]|nr:hypothetical protein [Halothiobacillus sp.]
MSETTNDLVDTTPLPIDQATETPTTETLADATAQPETPPDNSFNSKAVQKRIAKLTYEREEANRKATALEALLAAQRNGATPATVPHDFDQQVKQTAAQMRAQEAFNEASNATFQKGVSEFPDFQNAVQSYELIGGLNDKRAFVEAINALPNGHVVFHHLGKNLGTASEILEMTPVQMAIKLAELSGSLAKPKKAISNAPVPPAPLGGNAAPTGKDPSKMSMAEFMEWRKSTL